MTDRTFITIALAIGLALCGAAIAVVAPYMPDDALATPAGRVVELVTFVFGMIGAVSGSAQLRRMYATRSADDVSRGFLLMLSGSFLAWLAYGIVLVNWVMLTVNTLGGTITVVTLLYATRLQRRSALGRLEPARFEGERS